MSAGLGASYPGRGGHPGQEFSLISARAFRLIHSLQASDVVIPVMAGQDILLLLHHVFGVHKHKISGPFALALTITIDHELIAL